MTLLEECLIALGENVSVLSPERTTEVFDNLTKTFPISQWGRIDWEKIKHVIRPSSKKYIKTYITPTESEVYILWDEASLPAIKTNLNSVLDVIDNVSIVSFDTWIYNPTDGYVIEFYHENEITIGWANS